MLLKSGRNHRNKKSYLQEKRRIVKSVDRKFKIISKTTMFFMFIVIFVYMKASLLVILYVLPFSDCVCNICGKKYESKDVKNRHMYEHKEAIHLSKFGFQWHLTEQYQVHPHQQSTNGPYDHTTKDEEFEYVCKVCKKVFKSERNVYAHLYEVHYKLSTC